MNTSYHALRMSTNRGLLLVQCVTKSGGNSSSDTFLLFDSSRPHEAGAKPDFFQVNAAEARRIMELAQTDDRGSLPLPTNPFQDMASLRAWFDKERGADG